MKLQEGDRRTEFACLCCMERRWRKHPGQAWICPYRAKENRYCEIIESVYTREGDSRTSWEELGKRLAKERKKE